MAKPKKPAKNLEKKPTLTAAAICEKVLIEKDETPTLIIRFSLRL